MARPIDKDKLIPLIMRECEQDGEPVSRAEAEEMADMEIKARMNKTDKVVGQQDKERKHSTRERKVDNEKLSILTECADTLQLLGATVKGIKTETEVIFTFNGGEYSLKLIKHRPPKK